ncbi:MAG: hypothetical protein K2K84_01055 [Muribaculaceae bacterium]|nr:hypothetical protein [Muribaculaceae bacterium]
MSDKHNDINDDEIRVISSSTDNRAERKSPRRLIVWSAVVLALIAVLAVLLVRHCTAASEHPAEEVSESQPDVEVIVPDAVPEEEIVVTRGFTSARDTVVDGVGLTILTPRHAVPELVVGDGALRDTSAILVAQAADVRGDNGMIAGAFVVRGELLSRGEAKAGFCSIINGEVTVGVADATPMLEQALMTEGYFFRQFPLVVGGQLVENKPKGRSLRKALAEIDGEICVILSNGRLTFHDFSEALINAGARNAIYLVGSNAAGFYVDSDGQRQTFGTFGDNKWENTNYIVWK